MKVWWTARSLAEAGLPGVSTSNKRVIEAAERDGWQSREREGRGGGREYHVSSLPAAAQRALARRTVAAEMPVVERRRPQRLDELRQDAAGLAIARERVVAYTLEIAETEGKLAAIKAVAEDAAAARLPEELQALAGMANGRGRAGISARTLRRWVDAYEKGGKATVGLATRDDKVAPPPLWLHPLIRLYARPTKPSIAQCHEVLEGFLPEGVPMPSLRACQRAIEAIPSVERNRGRMGPRELRKLRPYVIRDFAELLPGDVYTADGHCHDQEVIHPRTGKPHRPEIISILDVATRRLVGWAAGHAESAQLIADGLRRACSIAVPAIWYVDRGSGFQAGAMTDPDIGLLDRLGIRRETSLPYNSQARGVIERFHKSGWIRGAKGAPGFIGQDMDPEARNRVYKRSRSDIRETGTTSVLMPWDDFVAWGDVQVAAYNARPHSSLPRVRDERGKLRHLSPDEAWAAKAAEAELLPIASDEADTLFMPVELRECRRGMVQINGHSYFAAELEWRHDETVQVAYDLHEASVVHVRDAEGRYICDAHLDANKAPYFPIETVSDAREGRRRQERVRRLDVKREAIEAEAPRPAAISYQPAPPTDEQWAVQAQLEAEFAARDLPQIPTEPSVESLPQDGAGRYRLWATLNARDPADLSERERHWLASYQKSSEWRSQQEMAAYTADFEAMCARRAADARAALAAKEDARR